MTAANRLVDDFANAKKRLVIYANQHRNVIDSCTSDIALVATARFT